ncbi:23 kDa integral membrane protein isoform X2 [Spodoptera frugiperda]|uniref:Tetraspanin n=1 Tax=Spodoptera frugiperda TaxID=7108 RepID=A0A9R0D162_SPOFR|nr:23 kDa integral membrane protein isoform X2 [Spodoptera frugiperda]
MTFNFDFKVPKVLKSVKYSLAAVNGVFLLTGLVLIIVGITALVAFNQYEPLLTNRFFNVSSFVISTGVIIILGSALGFYSAISQKFYFVAGSVLQYVVLLLVVLIFEVSMIITAFNLTKNVLSEIRPVMAQSRLTYGTNINVNMLWDHLQMDFECCGVGGPADYQLTQIPVSCCYIEYGTVSPFECGSNAYSVGCAVPLAEWLTFKTNLMAVTAVVLCCVQVLLSLMGGYLAYRSKFEVVELES